MGKSERSLIRKNAKVNNNFNNNRIWFEKLPQDKRKYIDDYIEKLVNMGNNVYLEIFDKCIKNALIDCIGDDIDVDKVISTNNDYIIDYNDFIQNKGSEVFKVINNVELVDKINKRILALMEEGVVKSRGLNTLKKEFDMPAVELSKLWIDCKEKYIDKKGRVKHNMNTVDTVLNNKSGISTITKSSIDSKTIIADDVKNTETKTSTLKCINIIKEIQGEYGIYIKNNNEVKVDDLTFKSPDEVGIKLKELTDIGSEIMDNFQKQMDALKKKIEDFKEQNSSDIRKMLEVIDVFNM